MALVPIVLFFIVLGITRLAPKRAPQEVAHA
jgi:Na+/H+-dicarboxylate symporter